jgi:ketosteroid isomerase-like protein
MSPIDLVRGCSHGLCRALLALLAGAITSASAMPSRAKDRDIVADLHAAYHAAARRNDAMTMGRILDERFVLVLGDGRKLHRSDLLDSADAGRIVYESHEDEADTLRVRVHGNTAVVTARVWLKGTKEGSPFDQRTWFSETYVRTAAGWRCAFAQGSLPVPSRK